MFVYQRVTRVYGNYIMVIFMEFTDFIRKKHVSLQLLL